MFRNRSAKTTPRKISVHPFEESSNRVSGALGEDDFVGNNQDAFTTNAVWDHFQYIARFMMAFGLFFPPISSCAQSSKSQSIYKVFRIYSVIILSIHTVNFFRQLTMFTKSDGFGGTTYFKITIAAFNLVVILGSVVMLRGCNSVDLMPKLFKQYGVLLKDEALNLREFCKIYMIMTIVGVLLLMLMTGSTVYCLFYSMFGNLWLVPHSTYAVYSDSVAQFVRVVVFIYQIFQSAAFIFPHIFLFLACYTLNRGFTQFNKNLKKIVHEDPRMEGRVEELRRRHQLLCGMTETVDDIFKEFIGVSMGLSIVCIILLLFVLLWGGESAVMFNVILTFWLMSVTSTMFSICVAGGMLNHEAHECKDTLYNIELEPGDPQASQLLTFLARVQGSPIAITVMDMFPVDKPSILTLIGTLVTYFLILMTFNPAASTVSTLCSSILIFVQPLNGSYIQLQNITLQ